MAAALLLCSQIDPALAADAPDVPFDPCPRPAPGSAVSEPRALRSHDGVLELDLALHGYLTPSGSQHFCYQTPDGSASPTLRVHPGDLLVLRLKNDLRESVTTGRPAPMAGMKGMAAHAAADDPAGRGLPLSPCDSGAMTAASTNLHFHGLTVPPTCHQDEVLRTSIQPSDAAFEYRVRIPADEAPGLYWYHPHIHGFSSRQVQGGASGALVVEGIEQASAEVAGLPERLLVIRDQELLHPDAPPPPSGQSAGQAARSIVDPDGDTPNSGTGTGRPSRDLSVNFVPVPYPDYAPARIAIRPGARELWRVLNASSVTYLQLSVNVERGRRFRAQYLGVVAMDGVPLESLAGRSGSPTQWRDRIFLAPGARAEFIMVGPPVGTAAMLVTHAVDTGPAGENDPNRPLASIVSVEDAPLPAAILPTAAVPLPPPSLPWLGSVKPTRVRRLYFSEEAPDPAHPDAPMKFYLTVDGQTPSVFDPARNEPNIVVRQGDVEDWVIENRSNELHAFHIHQLHFEVVEWGGLAVNEPFLRDTVNIPYWDPAMKPYPSVKLRMDFRDPGIVGTIVYHCHVLDHEDGGMMGTIRILAAAKTPPI